MLALLLLPVSDESSAQGTSAVTTLEFGGGLTLALPESAGTREILILVGFDNNVPMGSLLEITVGLTSTSATAGADFSVAMSTFTHTTTRNSSILELVRFDLTVIDDDFAEESEFIEITARLVGGTSTDPVGILLEIVDNDDSAVTLGPETVGEGDGSVTVTATLDVAVAGGFTVNVSTTDGTATTGSDYTTTTTALTFAGATGETQEFTVPILEDDDAEGDEMFTVALSGLTGNAVPVVITDTATVTITDNEGPTVTLDAATIVEGVGTVATLTARLSAAVSGGLTVTVSTTDGTATAGEDYTAVSGTELIFDGTVDETETFMVTITADSIAEGDETFTVALSGLTGTTETVNLGSAATITIMDDDTATVTLAGVSVAESAGTVTVSAVLDNNVPGSFTVTALITDVTATAGSDYTVVSGATVLNFTGAFDQNAVTGEEQSFTVTVTDDTLVEGDETLIISLTGLMGITTPLDISPTTTFTITDNDTATVTLDSPTVAEDVAGGMATVTATLDVAVQGGFTVTVSTTDGTATAGSDSDYTATTTMLTFAGTADETETFMVPIRNDADAEGDEMFTASLSGLTGTTATIDITSTATVTISDDDVPNVTLADVTVGEEAGTVTVTATLNIAVSGGFTVDASTADGTTNGATAGTDYTAVSGETLTFAGTAGEMQTVEVTISSDTDIEEDETFTVSLGTLAGTTLPVGISSTATVTIEDDDRPTITLGDVTVTEGDDPMTVTLTATLDIAVSGGLTADVSTTDDTATAGSDYTTTTTMLTFGGTAGETQEFTVPILDDEDFEMEEMFSVALTNTSVPTDINPATVTITDDDTPPLSAGLVLSPARVAEGSDPTTITVTATIAGGMSVESATEVTVTVAGGTATAGTDFTAVAPFTFTLAAGATSGTGSFVLTAAEDEDDDPNETLTVSAAADGISFTSATLTITEVDPAEVREAIVPELAQLSVNSVVDAVAGRIGRVVADVSAGPRVSFAGHPSAATALAANEQVLNEGGLDWQEFLGGSSFDLTLAGTETAAPAAGGQAASGGAIGFWASGDYERISSKDTGLGEWEGDLFSAHLGIDGHLSENVLVGLAVSWSQGSFEFDDDKSYNTDSQLVALSPYFGWNSGDGAGLWATVGHGRGEIEQEDLADSKEDLSMVMVAAGGNQRISAGSVWELDFRGEVSAAQMEIGGGGSFADVRRLRLALEAGSSIRWDSGAQLIRSVAFGIRHDGGDGDTGLGAELDGGLGWSFPVSGVTLRATGHVLLAHEGDLKEWGAGGMIHYAPAQQKGRGLSLRMQPSWGRAESTPGQLWEHRVAELESEDGDAPEARLVTDVGWGLPALSGRGLVTPYSGLELSEDGSPVYRLGSRVGIGSVFHIDLAGDRTEKGGRPEHGIDLHLRMQW